jgi:hypothetical protein
MIVAVLTNVRMPKCLKPSPYLQPILPPPVMLEPSPSSPSQ